VQQRHAGIEQQDEEEEQLQWHSTCPPTEIFGPLGQVTQITPIGA